MGNTTGVRVHNLNSSICLIAQIFSRQEEIILDGRISGSPPDIKTSRISLFFEIYSTGPVISMTLISPGFIDLFQNQRRVQKRQYTAHDEVRRIKIRSGYR